MLPLRSFFSLLVQPIFFALSLSLLMLSLMFAFEMYVTNVLCAFLSSLASYQDNNNSHTHTKNVALDYDFFYSLMLFVFMDAFEMNSYYYVLQSMCMFVCCYCFVLYVHFALMLRQSYTFNTPISMK